MRVLVFEGTYQAIKADTALKKAGIECKLMPVPKHIVSQCGVCVRVKDEDLTAAYAVIRTAGLTVTHQGSIDGPTGK